MPNANNGTQPRGGGRRRASARDQNAGDGMDQQHAQRDRCSTPINNNSSLCILSNGPRIVMAN